MAGMRDFIQGLETMTEYIDLPPEVKQLYALVKKLENDYPRKFTPDGHLVGSIGEVIAAKHFGLKLHPQSHKGHDAVTKDGREVQIKLTQRNSISFYDDCDLLIVLKIAPPYEKAEVVYNGEGKLICEKLGKPSKNGQRVLRLSKICKIRDEMSQKVEHGV